MTVAEFIEWLKTQDQEAEVLAMRREQSPPLNDSGYRTTTLKMVPFTTENENLWFALKERGKSILLMGEH